MRPILAFVSILFLSVISACKSQTAQTANPANVEEPYPIHVQAGYPAPEVEGERAAQEASGDFYVYEEFPAFQALSIALPKAQEWRKDAVLYQIPRLRQMEKNLSLPEGPTGWFFMFKDPGNPDLEYYIEVIDGAIVGTTEVQQIIFGEPPYRFKAIDLSTPLLDSPDVLQKFFQDKGKTYVKGKGRVELELRLVFLEGMEHPVWSIFNPETIEDPPIYNLDAVTGEITEDPFLPYLK